MDIFAKDDENSVSHNLSNSENEKDRNSIKVIFFSSKEFLYTSIFFI